MVKQPEIVVKAQLPHLVTGRCMWVHPSKAGSFEGPFKTKDADPELRQLSVAV